MNLRPKLFRDPVHDIISFELSRPDEASLFRLVCTPAVQRLRRIRQLGLSFLVYHGAEHSRFSHSMGVCHLTRVIFDALYPAGSLEDRFAVSAAALLHDVGHGPCSHVIEGVSEVRHERISESVLLDPGTEVHTILKGWSEEMPQRVADILCGKGPDPVLNDMVSSQLDADRLDYILRDGHATGVKIGNFDLGRILGMLRRHETGLVLSERAIEAVEGYLMARFHMYKQVYLHKASRSAERMLQACILRARKVYESSSDLSGVLPQSPFGKLTTGTPLSVAEHLSMDDNDLWMAFKAWSRSDDPGLRELAHGLLNRKLYKVVEIASDDPRGPRGAIGDGQNALLGAGGEGDVHFLVDNSRDTPYRPYQQGMRYKPIRFIDRSGTVRPMENQSAVVRMLGENAHETTRLFVPARFHQVVLDAAGYRSAPALL